MTTPPISVSRSLWVCSILFLLAGCRSSLRHEAASHPDLTGPIEGVARSVDSIAARLDVIASRGGRGDTVVVSIPPLTQVVHLDTVIVPPPQVVVRTVRDTLRVASEAPTLDLTGMEDALRRLEATVSEILTVGVPPRTDRSRWLIPLVGFGLQALALAVLILTWLANLRANAYLKGQDVILAYHERFARLMEQRADIVNAVSEAKADPSAYRVKADLFYRQFWFLNHQEFSFWRQGLVRPEVYKFWLRRRRAEADAPEPYLGSAQLPSFRDGWALVYRDFGGTDFQRFIEQLMAGRPPEDLVREYGPRASSPLRFWQWSKLMPGNLDEITVT